MRKAFKVVNDYSNFLHLFIANFDVIAMATNDTIFFLIDIFFNVSLNSLQNYIII